MEDQTTVVCMDSTHGTCVDGDGRRCFLYTLVVRSLVTGKGCPVAWMVTNSETHYPIVSWLGWVRDTVEFSPSQVMIDNSDTEIKALRDVFGSDTTVLICHWHIIRAWKKNIIKKVYPVSRSIRADTVRAKRAEALDILLRMMSAQIEDDFDSAYHDLTLFSVHNSSWDCTGLLVYFDTEYLPKKCQWSNVWRQVKYILYGSYFCF